MGAFDVLLLLMRSAGAARSGKSRSTGSMGGIRVENGFMVTSEHLSPSWYLATMRSAA